MDRGTPITELESAASELHNIAQKCFIAGIPVSSLHDPEAGESRIAACLGEIRQPGLARQAILIELARTPTPSPLALQLARWWANNLQNDATCTGEARLQTIANIYGRHDVLDRRLLRCFRTEIQHDLQRDDLPLQETAAYRWLNLPEERLHPDLRYCLRDEIYTAKRIDAPLMPAQDVIRLAAETDDPRLHSLARPRIQGLPVSAYDRLYRELREEPGYPTMHLQMRFHYSLALSSMAERDPYGAWRMVLQLRRNSQRGEDGLLSADQLPVADVFTKLMHKDPREAAYFATQDILALPAAGQAQQLHALQVGTFSFGHREAHLLFLADLHMRLLPQPHLVHVSRSGLLNYATMAPETLATLRPQLLETAQRDRLTTLLLQPPLPEVVREFNPAAAAPTGTLSRVQAFFGWVRRHLPPRRHTGPQP